MKPVTLKNNIKLIKVEPKDFLKNQKKVAKALTEALIDRDMEAFREILSGYLSCKYFRN